MQYAASRLWTQKVHTYTITFKFIRYFFPAQLLLPPKLYASFVEKFRLSQNAYIFNTIIWVSIGKYSDDISIIN